MKISLIYFVNFIIFFLGCYTLQAEETSAQIPEAIKKMDVFIGEWEGTLTLNIDGKTLKFGIKHQTVPVARGFGIQIIETGDTDVGMGALNSVNLFGYDAGEDVVHLFIISNWGETRDYKGKWADEKKLVVEYSGVIEGRAITDKITITVNSPEEYSFTSAAISGADMLSISIGNMKKKK